MKLKCILRQARLATRMSQRDLEEKSGVDHATISRTENGGEPTLTNALRLAKALNRRVEDLWSLAGPQKEEGKP